VTPIPQTPAGAPPLVFPPDPDPDGYLHAMIIPIYNRAGDVTATTIVDADIYPALVRWAWCLTEGGYVARSRFLPLGGRENLKLHRVVMCCTPNDHLQIDHINRNRLDNRRANLRFVTTSENLQNRELKATDVIDGFCRNGHLRTPANTKIEAGTRRCVECRRAAEKLRGRRGRRR